MALTPAPWGIKANPRIAVDRKMYLSRFIPMNYKVFAEGTQNE